MAKTNKIKLMVPVGALALLAMTFVALPNAEAATAGKYTPPGIPTTPTTPIVPKEPPPVVTLTNPQPKTSLERVPDLRNLTPGTVAAPIEATTVTRKTIVNRFENRSATSRLVDQTPSLKATQGASRPARELLETAKPIL